MLQENASEEYFLHSKGGKENNEISAQEKILKILGYLKNSEN